MSDLRRHHNRLIQAALATFFLVACGPASQTLPQAAATRPPASTPPPRGELLWPAPVSPLSLTVTAGLQPELKETFIYHVHAHLDVFVDGRRVLIPAGIGINIADPGVRPFQWNGSPAYAIAGCDQPCISPLHTHDESGVIHTESATSVPNKLDQFFKEWGVRLTGTCVGEYCVPTAEIAEYVNGIRYSGNAAEIQLTERKEIALVIGGRPPEIPTSFPLWARG